MKSYWKNSPFILSTVASNKYPQLNVSSVSQLPLKTLHRLKDNVMEKLYYSLLICFKQSHSQRQQQFHNTDIVEEGGRTPKVKLEISLSTRVTRAAAKLELKDIYKHKQTKDFRAISCFLHSEKGDLWHSAWSPLPLFVTVQSLGQWLFLVNSLPVNIHTHTCRVFSAS